LAEKTHVVHPRGSRQGSAFFETLRQDHPHETTTVMIRGLRPVDTVMFLFYLVLLGLGIVSDVRNANR
jgi:hypothetical protein